MLLKETYLKTRLKPSTQSYHVYLCTKGRGMPQFIVPKVTSRGKDKRG